MAKNLLYLSKASLLLLIQLLATQSGSFTNAKRIPEFSKSLKDVEESQHYLNKYGYLNYEDSNNFEEDEFDEALEVAIKTYQTFFHLKVTGKLDTDTIKKMSMPRCGVADIINGNLTHPQFSFLGGEPKWPYYKRHLQYAIVSSAIPNVNLTEVKKACSLAFGVGEIL